MSQPNIPNITPEISISVSDAVSLLISSIALEEIGLSHILNAEGEKIQYVLGTLPGGLENATIEEVLLVNKSVNDTLKNIGKLEYILSEKLETAVSLLLDSTNPTTP